MKIISFSGTNLPKQYEALVFSKWLRSLRKGNALFRYVDSHQYYSEYHDFIEKLLQKPDCIVKLAILSDDEDVVLGFSVSREHVLDYVYVQPEQRGQKLSEILIPKQITTFSHITKAWSHIWQAKYKEWIFNPKA